MEFLAAHTLWLLLILPLIFVVIVFSYLRKLYFSNLLGGVSPTAPLLHFAALGLVVALLIAASSRPYLDSETFELSSDGRDIMVVFDISRSMLAQDLSPNRLTFAKRKLFDLVEKIRARSPGDRIGIVLFAGSSYLYTPLTADYGALHTFIRAIDTNLMTHQGTALQEAIVLSIGIFNEIQSSQPVLVVFTDGEDPDLIVENLSAGLRSKGARIALLGFGTTEGSTIPIGHGRVIRDHNNQPVISRLEEEQLRALAQLSGGLYRRATLQSNDLEDIYRYVSLSDQAKSQSATVEITNYRELSAYISMVVIFIVIGALLLRRKELLFVFPLLLCMPEDLLAQTTPTLFESYRLYNRGEYERARSGFEAALSRGERSSELLQSLASSYYRLGDFDQAERLFEEAYELASTGFGRFQNSYNRGNASFMRGDYAEAIEWYEEALRIRPEHRQTEYNLELAKQLLDEQPPPEDHEQPDEQDQQSEDSEQSEQESQDGSGQGEGQEPQSDQQNQQDQEQDDPQGEQQDSTAEQRDPSDPEAQPQEEQELSPQEREARQWLDSIPEDRALIPRHEGRGQPQRGGQTW